MINEPLFQNNIINTIFRNFNHYLFFDGWIYYAAGTLLVLCISCGLMIRRITVPANLFPPAVSNDKTRFYPLAFTFALLTATAYIATIFSLENSLFNNHDLMNLGTNNIFRKGVTPFLDITRFAPAAFFDINVVYAVTHNFHLINIYIIVKQFLIAALFYHFLNFLTPAKRLFIIGLLLFVPALFWINNTIFFFLYVLIFILLSFISARNFSLTGKFVHLWSFAFCAAFAVYTKETTIIFYAGILAAGVICGVFNEKINFSNLFKPSILIKNFPIEFLIFFIGLSFSLFYFFIVDTSESNIYIWVHIRPLSDLLKLFKFEIIVTVIAWLIMIKKIIKNEVRYPLFDEGPMLGGTFILLFLIFHLKIGPTADHIELKSYYVLLTAIFSIIYIVRNMASFKTTSFFCAAVIIYSFCANCKIYQHEVGTCYREAAEFFAEENKHNEKISIMFSPQTEESDWVREGWAISYHYYFPDKDITFKFSDLAEKNKQNQTTLFLYKRLQKQMKPIIGNDIPEKNDYFIIRKGKAETDLAVIKDIPHDLVFENKLFRIYKIK